LASLHQARRLSARELVSVPQELKAALVNGFSQVADPDAALYYDTPDYWPFWETVERLDVRSICTSASLAAMGRDYEGIPGYWARLGFGVEAATHALRLMGSGLFDRCPPPQHHPGASGRRPALQPLAVDNRNNWQAGHRCPAKKPIGDYFRANFHLTTAGNFRSQTLKSTPCSRSAPTASCSRPIIRSSRSATPRLVRCRPDQRGDRRKIGRSNAIRLFKLALK